MHNSSLFTTKGLYFINFLAHNSSHHQMLHKVRIFTRLKWDDSIRLICWTLSCRCVQLYLCNLFRQREIFSCKRDEKATYSDKFTLSHLMQPRASISCNLRFLKQLVGYIKNETKNVHYIWRKEAYILVLVVWIIERRLKFRCCAEKSQTRATYM